MATSPQSIPGITAAHAIERAMRSAQGASWQLAYVSSTGVTCSVLADELDRAEDALIQPSGLAGQWVVEFFRKPHELGYGRPRLRWYRIRSIVVTALGATTLPDGEVEQAEAWMPLRLEYVQALDRARRRAMQCARTRFDRISVASAVLADGGCTWEFTLYQSDRRAGPDSLEIVSRVTVSGDGKQVLEW